MVNKIFESVLSGLKAIAKTESDDSKTQIILRHTAEGEIQNFLNSYQIECKEQINHFFQAPVIWKSIKIEANFKFSLIFDCLKFEAILKEIRVSRSFKKGIEVFNYDLILEKEIDSNDSLLSGFLKQKEIDENGKKNLVKFCTELEPIERLMKE